MRAKYPSDISPEQFEPVRALLESARKSTRPRSVDLYEVFCAVLYLLRTGCQWRALPSDFPKWRAVHAYFAIWSEPREGGSLLEQALKKSGWRGPRETGAQRLKHVLDRGRAEREEHGHGGQQGRSGSVAVDCKANCNTNTPVLDLAYPANRCRHP